MPALQFSDGQFNEPGKPEEIEKLLSKFKIDLPFDYVDLLRRQNGGEGFVGDNYLVLWKAEELEQFNREYEVERNAPGIFLFGSNGAGEAYGFDTRKPEMPVVLIPFIGMELQYATKIAATISALFIGELFR